MRLVHAAVVAMMSAAASVAAPSAGQVATGCLPGCIIASVMGDGAVAIPVDRDGYPMQPLSDAELFRVLVALSGHLDNAGVLLALCHAEGAGYPSGGWRECVERSGDALTGR